MEEIFTYFYRHNLWGSVESKSGGGSTDEQTKTIQEYIIYIVNKYNVKSFLDCPCGDFNWMNKIVKHIPNYIGGDVVKILIDSNKELYGGVFIKMNMVTDILPHDIDVVFCRDLLVHLPFNDICKVIRNIKKSNAKYLLMTTFIKRPFVDIHVGCWRPISFFDAPFMFPKPLELINEICTQDYPNYIDKSLGLWKVSDLPDM